MTISEQIREAALYARHPAREVSDACFDCLKDFAPFTHSSIWQITQGRTFMLLVAEALE